MITRRQALVGLAVAPAALVMARGAMAAPKRTLRMRGTMQWSIDNERSPITYHVLFVDTKGAEHQIGVDWEIPEFNEASLLWARQSAGRFLARTINRGYTIDWARTCKQLKLGAPPAGTYCEFTGLQL